MLRSAALATAATLALAVHHPASATAVADVSTLWAVYMDGITDALGSFTAGIPGISVAMTGDASYNGAWWGNILTLQRSVDDGFATFDVAAAGGLTISNADPANIGGYINVREDVSGARPLLLSVSYPGLESASAIGSVTATGQDSMVQCATDSPGACVCAPDCGLSDYSEANFAIPILSVGDIYRIDYSSSIHVALTGDPPAALPEPPVSWGFPLLIATMVLSYVRHWRH